MPTKTSKPAEQTAAELLENASRVNNITIVHLDDATDAYYVDSDGADGERPETVLKALILFLSKEGK